MESRRLFSLVCLQLFQPKWKPRPWARYCRPAAPGGAVVWSTLRFDLPVEEPSEKMNSSFGDQRRQIREESVQGRLCPEHQTRSSCKTQWEVVTTDTCWNSSVWVFVWSISSPQLLTPQQGLCVCVCGRAFISPWGLQPGYTQTHWYQCQSALVLRVNTWFSGYD